MKEFLNSGFELGGFEITLSDTLAVLAVFGLAQLFVWLIRLFLNRVMRKSGIDEGKKFIVTRLIRTLVYIIAMVGALQMVGIDLSLLIAGSAALLVGVGIGLQNFFNDVVSGFVLLFEGGVRVGDELEVEGMLVRVQRIDLRSTRVITRFGNLIVMPNGMISGQTVRNFTQGERASLLHIQVGVAYGSDVDRVKARMLQAVTEQKEVVRKKEANVIFQDFGDSALQFTVLFWVNRPWLREIVSSDIRFRINSLFQEDGIKIPFPQRDVHLLPPPSNLNPSASE